MRSTDYNSPQAWYYANHTCINTKLKRIMLRGLAVGETSSLPYYSPPLDFRFFYNLYEIDTNDKNT